MAYDLLIKNGLIVDGSGMPSFHGDLAVKDGKIVDIGKLSGALGGFAATELGGFAIAGALERAGIGPEQVDYVLLGQVLQAGAGQMPARQAAVKAGMLKEGEKVRFGFHNLRHSLASFLVRKGTDVKTVQKMLRHSDVTTTLGIYAHSMSEDRLAAQDEMLAAMMTPSNAVN